MTNFEHMQKTSFAYFQFSKFFRKKLSLVVIVGALLIIAGVAAVKIGQIGQIGRIGQNGEKKIKFGNLLKPAVTPAPSSVPTITPTPTLAPGQIAEIRRKKFEEMNKKYGPCRYVPVLMYHHVLEARQAKAIGAAYLNVPPEILRGQIDYLLQKGYSIIGLDEMVSGIKNNSLPAKPIVLTFDDGYRDFYDNVFPILKEKNIKAIVFVISQFVGGKDYLEWWHLREMVGSGFIFVGDHTLNHPYLPKLSAEEVKNQIVSSQKIIKENIGQKVEFFAYPYGSANQTAKEILKENGFLGAVVTTNSNPQCIGLPYDLSRIRIGATSLSSYGF